MKHQLSMRINVVGPPKGVRMLVQSGRSELLAPVRRTHDHLIFDFDILVDPTGPGPNFLGPFAQGPKDARFVYVNSGTYAGQTGTLWSRRAKIALTSITVEQVNEVLSKPSSRLETSFDGTGSDGGPTCASIKGIKWRVVDK
jgi:hypothetical protein